MEDNKKDVKVVNSSDNPNLKRCVKVLGLVVEDKVMVNGKDEFKWKEYSIVIDCGMLNLKCVVKIDSKQKQLIDQFGALDELSDVPWDIK